jgi:DNA adenine methylase
MTKKLSLIKTHGGKYYLSQWLISHFPKNYEQLIYCESFAGGANTWLQKVPSAQEFLNDADYPTYLVHKIMLERPRELEQGLNCETYHEQTFDWWLKFIPPTDELLIAKREIILRRFSRGGLKKTFAWSDRLRGGRPGDLNAWINFLASFSSIVGRYQKSKLTISNEDAIIYMQRLDASGVFFYCDPPYLHETRKATKAYDLEMTDAQHADFLDFCNNAKAKILISGYKSDLYLNKLTNWNRNFKPVANHSGQNGKKQRRTEWIWRNY